MLEALHLAPRAIDLVELLEVVDGLRTLRPVVMQTLLETCNSMKVKRLFLLMAQKVSLAKTTRRSSPLTSASRMPMVADETACASTRSFTSAA